MNFDVHSDVEVIKHEISLPDSGSVISLGNRSTWAPIFQDTNKFISKFKLNDTH